MFLSQVWFAAILACTASSAADIECREHLVGAFVNNTAGVEALTETSALIVRFADPAALSRRTQS